MVEGAVSTAEKQVNCPRRIERHKVQYPVPIKVANCEFPETPVVVGDRGIKCSIPLAKKHDKTPARENRKIGFAVAIEIAYDDPLLCRRTA